MRNWSWVHDNKSFVAIDISIVGSWMMTACFDKLPFFDFLSLEEILLHTCEEFGTKLPSSCLNNLKFSY